MNKYIHEDLTRLREELKSRAFNDSGAMKDYTLAEVVWKINGCLDKGYPRREVYCQKGASSDVNK